MKRRSIVNVLDSYNDSYLESLRNRLIKELSREDVVVRTYFKRDRMEYDAEFLRKVSFNVETIAIQTADASLIFKEPDYRLKITFS